MGLACWMFTALSRYYVVVRKRQVDRRQYSWMIVACTLIAFFNVSVIMIQPELAGMNAGGLLCITDWTNRSGLHGYLTACNVLLWCGAVTVSFWSYHRCFQYIKAIKQSLTHNNAIKWDQSLEIVQLTRLFRLTVALTCSWSVTAGQVWYSVITTQQVPPVVDQLASLLVAAFYLYQSYAVLRINQPLRNAVRELLSYQRHRSIQPENASSRRWTITWEPVSNSRTSVTTLPATPRNASLMRKKTSDVTQHQSNTYDNLLSMPFRLSTVEHATQPNHNRSPARLHTDVIGGKQQATPWDTWLSLNAATPCTTVKCTLQVSSPRLHSTDRAASAVRPKTPRLEIGEAIAIPTSQMHNMLKPHVLIEQTVQSYLHLNPHSATTELLPSKHHPTLLPNEDMALQVQIDILSSLPPLGRTHSCLQFASSPQCTPRRSTVPSLQAVMEHEDMEL